MTKYRPSRISDPLELLPHQSGIIDNPVSEGAAAGNTQLDKQQRAAVIGEPVPIVFCRRTGSGASAIGGVLAEPLCTEGRFVNDSTTNVLTLDFMLVLSEGDMNQLLLKDCFQRSCRVGTWEQTYNRRAGSFVPLYSITTVANKTPWNLPTYVGTSGRYEDMTTIHFSNTYADGSNNALKQVFCFVRDGMNVTRILDSTLGPSNNFIDLAIYLLKTRIPDALIDTTSMTAAATFLNANSLFFNGVFNRSSNLEDYLTSTGNHFLLRLSEKNGKKTFKPRVPTNTDGTIKVTAITPSYNFTEEHIIQGSFQVSYIPIEDRKNCNVQIIYREQPDDDIGIVRTAEIKFDGEASTGPYESHDLSTYCTSENHAVKVGSYIAIRKKTITHTCRISVRPSTFNATLELGDIVRVKLRRETEAGLSSHDYFYEIERIEKNTSGLITLDLTHFPIDNQKRSIVALLVNSATGSGALVGTSRTDFSCDVSGRRTDTSTTLSDVGIDYGSLPVSFDVPSLAEVTTTLNKTSLATAGGASTADGLPFNVDSYDIGGFGSTYNLSASGGVAGESGADLGDEANATDPLENPLTTSLTDNRTTSRDLQEGDTVTATGPTCAGGRILRYHGTRPLNADGTKNMDNDAIEWGTTPVQTVAAADMDSPGTSIYILTMADVDKMVKWVTECPDESSDTGFGTPVEIGMTDKEIAPNTDNYTHARWVGTVTKYHAAWTNRTDGYGNPIADLPESTTTTDVTTAYTSYGSGGYLTIGGAYGCVIMPVPQTGSDLSFHYPDIGPVEWRSRVEVVQHANCGGGSLSLGGFGVNGNTGAGCPGSAPSLSFSCYSKGSKWTISGKWELSTNGTTTAVTWQGVGHDG